VRLALFGNQSLLPVKESLACASRKCLQQTSIGRIFTRVQDSESVSSSVPSPWRFETAPKVSNKPNDLFDAATTLLQADRELKWRIARPLNDTHLEYAFASRREKA
jgi:hypothetical protein